MLVVRIHEVLMVQKTEWVESFVAENKVSCIYRAQNKQLIRDHAEKGGFPADKISMLSIKIGPATAKD